MSHVVCVRYLFGQFHGYSSWLHCLLYLPVAFSAAAYLVAFFYRHSFIYRLHSWPQCIWLHSLLRHSPFMNLNPPTPFSPPPPPSHMQSHTPKIHEFAYTQMSTKCLVRRGGSRRGREGEPVLIIFARDFVFSIPTRAAAPTAH